VLPLTLPTLLGQDYRGRLRAVLVDDESSDGTGAMAADLGKAAGWAVAQRADGGPDADPGAQGSLAEVAEAADAAAGWDGSAGSAGSAAPGDSSLRPTAAGDRELLVVAGRPLPEGWAGKVWAMSQGAAAAGDAEYLLFTDADIAYAPGSVAALAQAASAGQLGLLSQMALLRVQARAERVLVPAFVYFFAQLYPFRLVNRPRSRTAAAAGGCMLVSRAALAQAGGLAQIRGARIDDVALGRLLKRGTGTRCWLGLTRDVVSVREYPRLGDVWDMVARSAFTQLRYSLLAVAAVLIGLSWLYLLPPAAAVAGLAALAAGVGAPAAGLAAVGVAGWVLMSVSYVPMLRYYRLSAGRAPLLPVIAGLYAAMTADSARRHLAGRGGAWKGRVIRR
jgi:hopene-associated glycosyltransferase HpnB